MSKLFGSSATKSDLDWEDEEEQSGPVVSGCLPDKAAGTAPILGAVLVVGDEVLKDLKWVPKAVWKLTRDTQEFLAAESFVAGSSEEEVLRALRRLHPGSGENFHLVWPHYNWRSNEQRFLLHNVEYYDHKLLERGREYDSQTLATIERDFKAHGPLRVSRDIDISSRFEELYLKIENKRTRYNRRYGGSDLPPERFYLCYDAKRPVRRERAAQAAESRQQRLLQKHDLENTWYALKRSLPNIDIASWNIPSNRFDAVLSNTVELLKLVLAVRRCSMQALYRECDYLKRLAVKYHAHRDDNLAHLSRVGCRSDADGFDKLLKKPRKYTPRKKAKPESRAEE